jgi:hypothetical protein
MPISAKLPVHDDVPEIDVTMIDEPDPLRAQCSVPWASVRSALLVRVTAAIANAVFTRPACASAIGPRCWKSLSSEAIPKSAYPPMGRRVSPSGASEAKCGCCGPSTAGFFRGRLFVIAEIRRRENVGF